MRKSSFETRKSGRVRATLSAPVFAAPLGAAALVFGLAGTAMAQGGAIPTAPEPPPLSGEPREAQEPPVVLVPRPETQPDPREEPTTTQPAPAETETETETAAPAPGAPARLPSADTPVSADGRGIVGSTADLPLPPRRPPVPASFDPAPEPAAPATAPQQASTGSQATETETAQRFARDLDEVRAGFARVEGDMFWDKFTIGRDGRIECTTRAAFYGSSVAASFKENGIWQPGEPLKLSVPCETPDGRTIGLACVAQDRAPVLDLSCRIDPAS